MKKVFLQCSLLALVLIGLNSCDEPFYSDDEVFSLSGDNVPAEALDFVEANFPNYVQRYVQKEDICDGRVVFEVELEDGPGPDVDLYFNENGDFLFSGTEIRYSELPAAVQAAIEAFDSDYTIDSDDIERWEITADSILFEIELESSINDIEVVFTADGTLVCTDSDDDDDDDDDDDRDGNNDDKGGNDGDYSGNLPNEVRDYLQETYPSYRIDGVEIDDICENDRYYEVELEDDDGPDLQLHFSLDWTFQFKLQEIKRADLSDAVISVINTDYADYEIESDDIYRLDWADGRVMYEVELEGDRDDYEIIFNEDGSIYCEEK
ncbi:MAG TPA: PepSY-like domain-containing protein [Saprospiraceae bacterium]|nr:PepSY-like domain-containing protein [Saprospiraceae bacterium]